MQADPVLYGDTDRGELAATREHPGSVDRRLSCDAEVLRESNAECLQPSQPVAHVAFWQFDDRIDHELAGAVVGDVPATVGWDDVDPHLGEGFATFEKVLRVGVPSECKHGGVLEEKECAGLVSTRDSITACDLPFEHGLVRDGIIDSDCVEGQKHGQFGKQVLVNYYLI